MKSYVAALLALSLVFGCEEEPGTGQDLGPVPASPINLAIVSVTKSTIELSWIDNSTNEDGFIIERKIVGGTFTEIAQTDAEVSVFTDTQLTPSTEYSYRILAFNAAGKSESYTNVVVTFTLQESVAIDLETLTPSSIGSKSAFTGGSFSTAAFPNVTATGVVWSTNPSPTIELPTKTVDVAEVSGVKMEYVSTITGLLEETKYYVRAYATNAEGTVYGNELDFVTSQPFFTEGDGVTDVDGNFYRTVIIGEQEWMAQNLRTGHYTDGGVIYPYEGDLFIEWNNDVDGGWCYPGNLPASNATFGKFYNWYAVANSRDVCPTDWHVPSISDWNELFNNLGGPEVAGMRLKNDQSEWDPSPGTNESGFEALPAGNVWMYPTPFKTTIWWTSNSQAVNDNITVMYLSENQNLAQQQMSGPKSGLSIRCLKNSGN